MSHLMGPFSGWAKLRDREPVRLFKRPDAPTWFKPATAIARWNQLAGWSAIVIVSTEAEADVIVRLSSATYVQCLPDEYSAFTKTYIHCHPTVGTWRHAEHELGHAVYGFADHTRPDQLMQRPAGLQPEALLCGQTEPWTDPRDGTTYQPSPYRGIMSYCDFGQAKSKFFGPVGWYGAQDAAMMRNAWGFPA